MARAPFSIFTRKGSNDGRVFCVRFFDDSGAVVKTATLRDARSPSQAARMATTMLNEGVVSNAANPGALEYLLAFWTRGSDYTQGRALRGIVLSERYLQISRYLVQRHLSAPLKGKRLLDITPEFLEKTILAMFRAGCSARTINTAVQTLKVPYAYFCRIHRLANPLTCIEKVRENPRERGILTADEVGRVIALEGQSPRAVAGVLLGALCGLRLGEARGLQWPDVDFEHKTISIEHNLVWELEGVKAPKWGSARKVPAPAPVLDALRLCKAVGPECSRFVLWNSKRPGAPVAESTLPTGFHRILDAIGIDGNARKQRNLCFHGLRHTYVSLSRASGLPDFLVQRMAGHKSMVMTDHYSHAEGLVDFAAARASLEGAVARKEQAGAS